MVDLLNRSLPASCFQKNLLGTPSYPSPLDRVRDGKRELLAVDGPRLNFMVENSFELNQSFPKLKKPLRAKNANVPLCAAKRTLDDFKGTAANDIVYSPIRRPCSATREVASPVANASLTLEKSLNLDKSWAFYNFLHTVEGKAQTPPACQNPYKAILVINARSSEILIANNLAVELFGFPDKELIGQMLTALLKPKGSAYTTLPESLISKSGEVSRVCGKVMEVVDTSGSPIAVSVWISEPIEEQDSSCPTCIVALEPVQRTVATVTVDKSVVVNLIELFHPISISVSPLTQCQYVMCDGMTFRIDLIILLRSGKVIFADTMFTALMGHDDRKDVLDRDIDEFLPTLTLPSIDADMKPMKKQHTTARNSAGQSFPVSVRLDPSKDPVDSVVTRITLWVFSSISGMLTLLEDGTIHSCNENFARILFGYPVEELIHKPVSKLIPHFFDSVGLSENNSWQMSVEQSDSFPGNSPFPSLKRPETDNLLAEASLIVQTAGLSIADNDITTDLDVSKMHDVSILVKGESEDLDDGSRKESQTTGLLVVPNEQNDCSNENSSGVSSAEANSEHVVETEVAEKVKESIELSAVVIPDDVIQNTTNKVEVEPGHDTSSSGHGSCDALFEQKPASPSTTTTQQKPVNKNLHIGGKVNADSPFGDSMGIEIASEVFADSPSTAAMSFESELVVASPPPCAIPNAPAMGATTDTNSPNTNQKGKEEPELQSTPKPRTHFNTSAPIPATEQVKQEETASLLRRSDPGVLALSSYNKEGSGTSLKTDDLISPRSDSRAQNESPCALSTSSKFIHFSVGGASQLTESCSSHRTPSPEQPRSGSTSDQPKQQSQLPSSGSKEHVNQAILPQIDHVVTVMSASEHVLTESPVDDDKARLKAQSSAGDHDISVFDKSFLLPIRSESPTVATSTPHVKKNNRSSDSVVLIPEGSFTGQCEHKDGFLIDILYQIKQIHLSDGDILYCIWISRDINQMSESFINLTLASSTSDLFTATATHRDRESFVSPPEKIVEEDEDQQVPVEEEIVASAVQPTEMSPGQADQLQQSMPGDGEFERYYIADDVIGKGAFGFVKVARCIKTNERVIVKFIKKRKIQKDSWIDDDALGRVPLEISLLARLQHENIVKVIDVFENSEFFQMVMEKHGDGMDLFEFIDRSPHLDEPLCSGIFRQLVNAIHYLHAVGILHRDVKDENIIIDRHFNVKLIDFGAAAFLSPGKTFSTFCGTIEYCSPEVLLGHSYCGPELEVWSMGVTLYTLVFGENPFYDVEETVIAVLKPPCQVSERLMHLLRWMLQKSPAIRAKLSDVSSHAWTTMPVKLSDYSFEEVLPKYVFKGNTAADERKDSEVRSAPVPPSNVKLQTPADHPALGNDSDNDMVCHSGEDEEQDDAENYRAMLTEMHRLASV